MRIIIDCPSVGVPDGAAKAAAAAWAVTVNSSLASASGVGVALDAVVPILAVRRLFDKGAAAARSVAFDGLSTFPRPTPPLTMPVRAFTTGAVRVLFVHG